MIRAKDWQAGYKDQQYNEVVIQAIQLDAYESGFLAAVAKITKTADEMRVQKITFGTLEPVKEVT